MLKLETETEIKDQAEKEIICLGSLMISVPARCVELAGQFVSLTVKEFDLLVTLVSAPGRIFTRAALLEEVWSYSYLGKSRTVDVHIAALRRKLESVTEISQAIQTVWGIGYTFRLLSPLSASVADGEKRYIEG